MAGRKTYISFFEKYQIQIITHSIGMIKIKGFGEPYPNIDKTYKDLDRIIFNGERLVTLNDRGIIKAI